LVVVHHALGARFGRAEQVASWRPVLRSATIDMRFEPLATLGEALALVRRTARVDDLPVVAGAHPGPSSDEAVAVLSVRGDERVQGRSSLLGAIQEVDGGYDDVLALEPDGHVVRMRITAVDRATGGAVELEHVIVSRFNADGLLQVREFLPAHEIDASLARFD